MSTTQSEVNGDGVTEISNKFNQATNQTITAIGGKKFHASERRIYLPVRDVGKDRAAAGNQSCSEVELAVVRVRTAFILKNFLKPCCIK